MVARGEARLRRMGCVWKGLAEHGAIGREPEGSRPAFAHTPKAASSAAADWRLTLRDAAAGFS